MSRLLEVQRGGEGDNSGGRTKSFKRLEQSATNCIVSRSICGHANGDMSPTYSCVHLLGCKVYVCVWYNIHICLYMRAQS